MANALSTPGSVRQYQKQEVAQQQLLQAGVHPSEVPGLEGGMEIEIDEETIARHAAARKQEL